MKGVGEIDLEDLGYDAFFASGRRELGLDDYTLARVIAEHKGAYSVKGTHGEYLAAITGKQMHGARSREDYPAVGDWVAITETGEGKAVIHDVLPRKTILKRKSSGRYESQVIAANIDIAFIVEAAGSGFSLNRAERYLTLAMDSGIKPVIVLNKVDLIPEAEIQDKVSLLQERFKGAGVIKTSAVLANGLDADGGAHRQGRDVQPAGVIGGGQVHAHKPSSRGRRHKDIDHKRPYGQGQAHHDEPADVFPYKRGYSHR